MLCTMHHGQTNHAQSSWTLCRWLYHFAMGWVPQKPIVWKSCSWVEGRNLHSSWWGARIHFQLCQCDGWCWLSTGLDLESTRRQVSVRAFPGSSSWGEKTLLRVGSTPPPSSSTDTKGPEGRAVLFACLCFMLVIVSVQLLCCYHSFTSKPQILMTWTLDQHHFRTLPGCQYWIEMQRLLALWTE